MKPKTRLSLDTFKNETPKNSNGTDESGGKGEEAISPTDGSSKKLFESLSTVAFFHTLNLLTHPTEAVQVEYKGINFYKRVGCWDANLWLKKNKNKGKGKKGGQAYLGSYSTASEAARAYDKGRLKKFGETVNFLAEEYGKDVEEMAQYRFEEYKVLLQKRAKSQHTKAIEGITVCPEGWYEVKNKNGGPQPRSEIWRLLGRFKSREEADRCYQAAL